MTQERRAVAIGELARVQQGAKEVSSGGDSYFTPSRPGQFLVTWGLAPSRRTKVSESVRDVRGLWAPSATLAARAGCQALRARECRELAAPPRMENGGLVAGTALPYHAGVLQVINGKRARGGMGQKLLPQSAQGMETGDDCPLDCPRSLDPMGRAILQSAPGVEALIRADDLQKTSG